MPTRSTPELVVLFFWLAWYVSWMVAAVWRDRAAKQPPTRSQITYRVLAIVGVLLLFDGDVFDAVVPPLDGRLWRWPLPLQWTTVAVSFCGFAFTWWARIHLGRLWSSNVGRKADHRIVDTGPYGIVRHPIYTGIALAMLGTALTLGTLPAWLGVAAGLGGILLRVGIEDRLMAAEFGAAHAAYRQRTKRLIPFVW